MERACYEKDFPGIGHMSRDLHPRPFLPIRDAAVQVPEAEGDSASSGFFPA